MKKIFIYILTAIIAVTSLAFPAYADSEPSYDVDALYAEAMEKYNEFMQDTEDSSVQEVNAMLIMPYHCFIVYQDRSYKYLTLITSANKDISYSSDDYVVRGTDLFYTYFEWDDNSSFGCRYSAHNVGNSTPSNSLGRHMPIDAFLKNYNFNFSYDGTEYSPFNPLSPPNVFTYSIDKPAFTLKNNDNLNVHIEFTPDYIKWIEDCATNNVPVQPGYNFLVYVSSIKPVDNSTLAQSLQNVNYTKLNYGEYLYEGGNTYDTLNPDGGYTAERDYTASAGAFPGHGHDILAGDEDPGNERPFTYAQGTYLSIFKNPEHETSFDVSISLENIYGFDEHKPIYVCVLGAWSPYSIADPQMFNNAVLDSYFTNSTPVNEIYKDLYWTHSQEENAVPDAKVHVYYFPFDCVDACCGDGYNGNYTYKPQILNGKEYDTFGRVTDYTNKTITPDLLHDNTSMQEGQWVKPEDYSKLLNEFYQNQKYNSEFSFNTQTLKDIFKADGDFFRFVGVSLSVLPDYFPYIFVAFLLASFVIALLKHLL